MDTILKADPWFINLVALAGAGYFLYSAKGMLVDLKNEIRDLKETIKAIFEKHDNHERRISRIEGLIKGRRLDDAGEDGIFGG